MQHHIPHSDTLKDDTRGVHNATESLVQKITRRTISQQQLQPAEGSSHCLANLNQEKK
jgi:hypothetical protein